MKRIKLLILKSGEQVLANVREVIQENADKTENLVGFALDNPVTVLEEVRPAMLAEDGTETQPGIDVLMNAWIRLTKNERVIINNDWVVTMVDPIDELVDMYNKRFEETNDSNSTLQE